MSELNTSDCTSSLLARRALLFTLSFSSAGAALGIVGAHFGTVVGQELTLIICSLLFSSATLVALLLVRRIALQSIATVSTVGFLINLCAGMMIAAFGVGDPLNLFVYLVWFFPLLVFNKLVNQPTVGKFLSRVILTAPLVGILCLLPRLVSVFRALPLILLAVYCLSYAGFGLMFDIVARYREEFVIERARAESLKLESEILESISDCFISLNSKSQLIYLNDAACSEFDVERQVALKQTLATAAPGLFSLSVRSEIEKAGATTDATIFEAHNQDRDTWYVVRCYPRADGLSIYFRNVTESILSRRELEHARDRARQQAELLDKAQDAIFVVDMDYRLRYWNKGAERLYGWAAGEVEGLLAADVFHYLNSEMNERVVTVTSTGQWVGEISQRHRDGRILTVESHVTLVKNEHGIPQSILAINTDITRRKAAEARMERLAFYDPLTDLPNRQYMRERLERALNLAARNKTTGALLFIDLDDFKTLNDTLGHHIGDLLLQQVAVRLQSCTRKTDTIARLGGDEFVVMLEDLKEDEKTASSAAKVVAEKILEAFLPPFSLATYETESTAGIGIALFSGSSDTADELLKRADLAMYRAKAHGRNTMCFFDPEMQTYATSRATLRSDLRRAVQNNEFELFYQPQVNRDGNVMSAEALLRWPHPQRGMIPPSEFIPLSEDAGLIVELGRWVLETACLQLAKWAENPSMAHLSIAVNVSLRQLLDFRFVDVVLEVLRNSGANPRKLKLEITESAMLEKLEDTIEKIKTLKQHGIGFSLDDFGTGYSSLSHLKRLPLDQLKVDRAFISDLLISHKGASIACTIITLGQNLDLTVIAEGVETEGQRQFLEREGCYMYQGFLFSPALNSSKFETYVRSTLEVKQI